MARIICPSNVLTGPGMNPRKVAESQTCDVQAWYWPPPLRMHAILPQCVAQLSLLLLLLQFSAECVRIGDPPFWSLGILRASFSSISTVPSPV